MIDLKFTHQIKGFTNRLAADKAECVILSIPYSSLEPILSDIGDCLDTKTIIVPIVPLVKVDRKMIIPVNRKFSVAEEVASRFPQARVVSTLQHIAAKALLSIDKTLQDTVIVCCDQIDTYKYVQTMIESIANLKVVYAGALVNSTQLEQITPLILMLNKQNKTIFSLNLVDHNDE